MTKTQVAVSFLSDTVDFFGMLFAALFFFTVLLTIPLALIVYGWAGHVPVMRVFCFALGIVFLPVLVGIFSALKTKNQA